MIKVLFFAKLSEQLATRELLVDVEQATNVETLFNYLLNYEPHWATILQSQSWLTAVNQTMTNENVILTDGDEVAFFPPVTGG